MDLHLKDRRALVTASSRGLGRAVAGALLAEGARVVLCGRDEKRLEEAAAVLEKETGTRPFGVRADVSRADDRARLVEEAETLLDGSLEILVTNAGGPLPGPFSAHTLETWEDAVRLTLMSTVDLVRLALPSMRKNRFGRIVQLVSIAGLEAVDGLVLSNALRPGVLGFGRALAREVASDNVLINAICPGMFLTDRVRDLAEERGRTTGQGAANYLSGLQTGIPLGRMGDPGEVGDLAAFLASPRNTYITGSSFVIDGGLMRRLGA